MIQGRCHCGNVTLAVAHLTATATECNCSICSRYAALWGYFKQAEVAVTDQGGGIEDYCWGDQMLVFHRCAVCGCVTHYTSTPSAGRDRLAVNYRMFDRVIQQSIPVRHFDGADSWRYLD